MTEWDYLGERLKSKHEWVPDTTTRDGQLFESGI